MDDFKLSASLAGHDDDVSPPCCSSRIPGGGAPWFFQPPAEEDTEGILGQSIVHNRKWDISDCLSRSAP